MSGEVPIETTDYSYFPAALNAFLGAFPYPKIQRFLGVLSIIIML